MILERVESRGWDRCIVAATGPSLTPEVAEQCRGQRVVAVNDAYRLLPFADVLYGGDREWWDVHEGCPDYQGEKWTAHDPRHNDKTECSQRWGLRVIAGMDREGFSTDPARIHYGGNSGFQAINLALLFGARRICLVGFDMRTTPRRHFFGDHPPELKNSAKYEYFIPAYNAAARIVPEGLEILNCTPGSALRCFPSMDLEDALAVNAE